MTRPIRLSRLLLFGTAFALVLLVAASLPIWAVEGDAKTSQTVAQNDASALGRGRGVKEKRGAGHAFAKVPHGENRQSLFQLWKEQRKARAAAALSTKAGRTPQIPISPGAVGRNSVVINDGNQILFSRHFPAPAVPCDPNPDGDPQLPSWQPGTAYAVGAVVRSTVPAGQNAQATTAGTSGGTQPAWPAAVGATVNDGTVVWQMIAFPPGSFAGCSPMELVIRSAAGVETTIATEGQTLPDGSQLGGWAEFYDMNNAGLAVFKAALVGPPYIGETNSFGADESGAALFRAGVSSPLAVIARPGAVVGGQTICGIGPFMKINASGQVGFEGFFLNALGQCDEDVKGVFRFTPPATLELLFATGTDVGGGVTVTLWGDFGDGDFVGEFNDLGHSVAVVQLSDGDQGIYLLNGPGSFTEIARSGGSGPSGIYDRFGAQCDLNNVDQVFFKAAVGGDGTPGGAIEDDGTDTLFLFTPGSGTEEIAQRNDAAPGGSTYQGFGAFADLNDLGNVVFRAGINATTPGVEDDESAGIFFWNRSTGITTSVQRASVQFFAMFAECIAINNANAVAFGIGGEDVGSPGVDDYNEQEDGLYRWTPTGGVVQLLRLGNNLDGSAVTSIFAQHIPFERQFNEICSFASAAYIGNDQPDEANEIDKNGKLFAAFTTICPAGGVTPTPSLTATTGPSPTPTIPLPTPTINPNQPTSIPTLSWPVLAALALALSGLAIFVIRKL